MLRLVHPSKEGKVSARPKGRRSQSLSLTATERARLRATIRNLRQAYGSTACLAEVLGVSVDVVNHLTSTTPISYAYVVKIARALKMTVDQLIGPLVSVDICPTCGARKGAK